MLSICKIVNYWDFFCIVIFPIRCKHDLKISRPAVCKLLCFSSNSYRLNYLTVFFNIYSSLFRQKCFYFIFSITFSWTPPPYIYSFKNSFCSDHDFITVDKDIFIRLIIFSMLSVFTLKRVAKNLVRTLRKVFFSSSTTSPSKSFLTFSTMFL